MFPRVLARRNARGIPFPESIQSEVIDMREILLTRNMPFTTTLYDLLEACENLPLYVQRDLLQKTALEAWVEQDEMVQKVLQGKTTFRESVERVWHSTVKSMMLRDGIENEGITSDEINAFRQMKSLLPLSKYHVSKWYMPSYEVRLSLAPPKRARPYAFLETLLLGCVFGLGGWIAGQTGILYSELSPWVIFPLMIGTSIAIYLYMTKVIEPDREQVMYKFWVETLNRARFLDRVVERVRKQ